ncbi:Acinus (induces apoptotic chromatin condensation) [Handroanthus impetiginosus]|uniref:Acinus (Induces apoptotic chromatin condensation) n=1 Tax=Handroanthus impetiginosus TaxID=429701 RepID=A0A2G9GCU1_9LAMI|nr:Acinus (induces apoptotic chromatin condensation) [Handroanthus impetiginosus]
MSSPYVTLGNRTLDQWKVTELKEELKRRKLTTKGLKEDLVKRLDEAVRFERENATEDPNDKGSQPEPPFEQAPPGSAVPGRAKNSVDIGSGMVEKVDAKPEHEINDHRGSLGEDKVVEVDVVQGTTDTDLEGKQDAEFSVATSVVTSETVEPLTALSGSLLHSEGKNEDGDSTAVINNDDGPPSQDDVKLEQPDPNTQSPQINESRTPAAAPSEPRTQGGEALNEAMHSTAQIENDDSKCLQPDSSVQPLKYQVPEVDPDLGFQVTSDSVSTESVSIIEKNELKVDVITDNVQLELDVKHEMMQSSPRSAVPDGGESHPMDVEEPLDQKDIQEPLSRKDVEGPLDQKDVEEPVENKVSVEVASGSNAENVDSLKNIDTGDSDPPEKLNLDRSSGDDSMEEDILESKQTDDKSDSNKSSDNVEKSGMPVGKEEEDHVDVVGHDKPVETKVTNAEKETVPAPTSAKRKFHDKEAVGNNDTVKKARRWNAEGLKVSETQSGNMVASTTPKGVSEPTFKRTLGTEPTVNDEVPKERVVPPSSKPPTNSLRIDRFLRPFTLKAVQELLGKTGTVTSFWMDHIKTHCYVSYSSVEEAVETRNAVYNLQWPPNGGRLLLAEFVDPQEVKAHLEPPAASPAAPSSSAAPTFPTTQHQPVVQPQPSPRQQVPRQPLPPPSLPPSLSNPPHVRERLHPAREPVPREQPLPARERLNLPPPPPLPEKVDPPIVTLDDLFRKTKATPRIYYLPLSDEQVAAKLKAQGKNVNQ